MMPGFLSMLELPGCLQCRAEEALASDPEEVRREIHREITSNPKLHRVPSAQMRADLVEDSVRVGVRQFRLNARIILLEPHECGKERP